MPRLTILTAIFVAIILSGVFGVVLVSQVHHRFNPHQDSKPVRLTRAQITDSVSVVSEMCDRITIQSGGKLAALIQTQNVETTELVSDVCRRLGADTTLMPAQLYRNNAIEPGDLANVPTYELIDQEFTLEDQNEAS